MGRRSRRRELFPADRGLMARMVVASVLTPLIVVGALVASVAFLPLKVLIPLGIFALIGLVNVWPGGEEDVRVLGDGEEPELQGIVDRLCLVADLERPEIAVHEERQANSWIVDAPGRRPRLHVTRGLLELLEPEDSTALSRYRELTADAGAAQLTGRPAALASALRKISGELALVPDEDLRAIAGRDALHVVAVGDEPRRLWRLQGRSHPSIEKRIAALERLEHRLAHARRDLAA